MLTTVQAVFARSNARNVSVVLQADLRCVNIDLGHYIECLRQVKNGWFLIIIL
jgi:hypothetical protein